MKSLNKIIVAEGANNKCFEDKGNVRTYENDIYYNKWITASIDIFLNEDNFDKAYKAFEDNTVAYNTVAYATTLKRYMYIHIGAPYCKKKGFYYFAYKANIPGYFVKDTAEERYAFIGPNVKIDDAYMKAYIVPSIDMHKTDIGIIDEATYSHYLCGHLNGENK